jgi:hypothetical protein
MMKTPVPAWLLSDLFLDAGEFSEDGKSVTGRPNTHLSAVLNVGNGSPSIHTVRLTDAQLERLHWSDAS